MQYTLRYDIKPARSEEFRAWLVDHDAALRESAPDGWDYEGTYFTVRGFGDYACETRWAIDGYAALGSGFGDEAGVRLTQEFMDFVDQARPWQATLYKGATEVDILPGT
jgi:hypothetical protein